MTASIIRTFTIPEILTPVSTSSPVFTRAKTHLFYFRGGTNVISISRLSQYTFEVYVPMISNVDGSRIYEILSPMISDVEKEMEFYNILYKQPFLFDISTKRIITEESFMLYVPVTTYKKALMLFSNESAHPTKLKFYHLENSSSYAEMAGLPVSIAKTSLLVPKSGIWSISGKMILTYLIAKQHAKDTDFHSGLGPWSDVVWDFMKDNIHRTSSDITALPLTRARTLAQKFSDGALVSKSTRTTYIEKGVMLSDVLESGADSFLKSYDVAIEVIIDLFQDIYKTVIIDCPENLVMVELNPGISKTFEKIQEELGTDNILLVTDPNQKNLLA